MTSPTGAVNEEGITLSRRPRLLDLFCKAGGAGTGYHRAGFDVVGVDHEPQPNYPFDFIQADALTVSLDGFDAVHASPPCQANIRGMGAVNRKLGRISHHVDLIPTVRARLRASGLPFVIENVEGAALVNPVRICGTSFGLPTRRHRLFESSHALMVPPCDHGRFTIRRYWTSHRPGGKHLRSTVVQVYGSGGEKHEWGPALGIDWMAYAELAQAIPPAYTALIGRQLLDAIRARAA